MTQTLIDRIDADLSAAMRARDPGTLAPLRMLKTALVNRRIEQGRELTHEEALRVVASLVKQRRDSIAQFSRAGRTDLAERESSEIGVLEAYLPPPVGQAEIEAAVDEAIVRSGASSVKEMGTVMKLVMASFDGRTVDGKTVSDMVRSRLAR
jgi:hypothetical protein